MSTLVLLAMRHDQARSDFRIEGGEGHRDPPAERVATDYNGLQTHTVDESAQISRQLLRSEYSPLGRPPSPPLIRRKDGEARIEVAGR